MKFRTAYDEPLKVVSSNSGEVVTSQAFEEQCKIESILRKYQDVGLDPSETMPPQQFADVFDVPDYETTQQRIAEFTDYFMSLKPEIREQFENNPAKLATWLSDPENHDEAVAQGFIRGGSQNESPLNAVSEKSQNEEKPSQKIEGDGQSS